MSLRKYLFLIEAELPDSIWAEAAKHLINYIDWSDPSRMLDMLGYDDDDDVAIESPEFQSKLMAWAENRAHDAYINIMDHVRTNDRIRVYRVITAPPDWTPDPTRHPGLFWSWNEHAAEAHWGSFGTGHVKWLLIADVTFAQIDWVSTLATNGLPDQEDECEITLRDDSHITLASYSRIK